MAESSNTWLPGLIVPAPGAGFGLAVELARSGVKPTRPSDAIRKEQRPKYEHGAAALIASSPVTAARLRTVAAANDWRKT
jgi:hypothetical protein